MRRYMVLLGLLVVVMTGVEAGTQRLGDECNWKKNCQNPVDGAGPEWAKGQVTCAVPQENKTGNLR